MTQVNGQSFTVAGVDDDNFTIGVNTTGYTAYCTGGLANTYLPWRTPLKRYQLIERYWWPGTTWRGSLALARTTSASMSPITITSTILTHG